VRNLNKIVLAISITLGILTASWFIVGHITSVNWETVPDENGIPFVDYGTISGTYVGEQRNPLKVSQWVVKYYDSFKETGNDTHKKYMINNANWLVDNAVIMGNYSILEYNFPYPPYNMPQSSWRDAYAQANAIKALTMTHEITNNKEYLDAAKLLLNSFFVEIKDGGVSYKTSDVGWWYEHYAHEGGKEPRVLNAMMAAMMGIYDYYKYTNDADAIFVFKKGVTALKNDLPS